MNSIQLARTAYTQSARPIRTSRRTEYDAFASITGRIRTAVRAGNDGFAALVEALHENRKLWILLAADVADSDNGLSSDLRARIFYLAEFTVHHTSRVLAGEAHADVLVEINSAVMNGLGQKSSVS